MKEDECRKDGELRVSTVSLPPQQGPRARQRLGTLLEEESPDAEHVRLDVRVPVNVAHVEIEHAPVVGRQRAAQRLHVIVREGPLARREVLKTGGRLLQLVLHSHHPGSETNNSVNTSLSFPLGGPYTIPYHDNHFHGRFNWTTSSYTKLHVFTQLHCYC